MLEVVGIPFKSGRNSTSRDERKSCVLIEVVFASQSTVRSSALIQAPWTLPPTGSISRIWNSPCSLYRDAFENKSSDMPQTIRDPEDLESENIPGWAAYRISGITCRIVSPCHPFTHRVHVATERVLTDAVHYMHENLTATCTICILVVSPLTDCCPVSNPVENLQTFFVLARTESLSSPARCTQLFTHHMSLKSKLDTSVDMPSLMSKLVHQGTSWNI